MGIAGRGTGLDGQRLVRLAPTAAQAASTLPAAVALRLHRTDLVVERRAGGGAHRQHGGDPKSDRLDCRLPASRRGSFSHLLTPPSAGTDNCSTTATRSDEMA